MKLLPFPRHNEPRGILDGINRNISLLSVGPEGRTGRSHFRAIAQKGINAFHLIPS